VVDLQESIIKVFDHLRTDVKSDGGRFDQDLFLSFTPTSFVFLSMEATHITRNLLMYDLQELNTILMAYLYKIHIYKQSCACLSVFNYNSVYQISGVQNEVYLSYMEIPLK
jgi:hypothetical protein